MRRLDRDGKMNKPIYISDTYGVFPRLIIGFDTTLDIG